MITEADFFGGAERHNVSTVSLTPNSARLHVFTVPATVTLPPANLLSKGAPQFYLVNQSSANVVVKDGSGTTIETLGAGQSGEAGVLENDTVAGVWSIHKKGLPPSAGVDFLIVVDGSASMGSAELDQAADVIDQIAAKLRIGVTDSIKGRVTIYHGYYGPDEVMHMTNVLLQSSSASAIFGAAETIRNITVTPSNDNDQYAKFWEWMAANFPTLHGDHGRCIVLGDGGSLLSELPTGVGLGSGSPSLAEIKAILSAANLVAYLGQTTNFQQSSWETAIEDNTGNNLGSLPGFDIGDTRTQRYQRIHINPGNAAAWYTAGAT